VDFYIAGTGGRVIRDFFIICSDAFGDVFIAIMLMVYDQGFLLFGFHIRLFAWDSEGEATYYEYALRQAHEARKLFRCGRTCISYGACTQSERFCNGQSAHHGQRGVYNTYNQAIGCRREWRHFFTFELCCYRYFMVINAEKHEMAAFLYLFLACQVVYLFFYLLV
jgi:hypothetical protein